jgi:hypothetical protein
MLGGRKVSQTDAPGCAMKVSFEDLKPVAAPVLPD